MTVYVNDKAVETAAVDIAALHRELALPDMVAIALDNAVVPRARWAERRLSEGDKLVIPELVNTIKISGDVMFPNTVMFKPGKKLKYYIDQAGGYGERAKKNKAFIVYMNGSVARAKGNVAVEPGCQIIVPSKQKSKGVNWSAILSMTGVLTGLGTMAAAISNMVK